MRYVLVLVDRGFILGKDREVNIAPFRRLANRGGLDVPVIFLCGQCSNLINLFL
ncbi:hypothetical protein D3C73_1511080 [compost metagenome]